MKKTLLITFLLVGAILCSGQTIRDSMLTYKAEYDQDGKLLSWYKPETPGAGYDRVVDLASEFLLNCPVEPSTNMPLYMIYTWFPSPDLIGRDNFEKGNIYCPDGHTPACTFANFVQSLAVKYYAYTGNREYVDLVKFCLDHLIEHGTTPDDPKWAWNGVPYASANPKSTEYWGATHWGVGGRNDGPFVIEGDKVGEMGIAYLDFYKVLPEEKYLDAAIKCADALAKNCRFFKLTKPLVTKEPFISPWPFRASAENGQVHEGYTANVIFGIRLFDELIRLKDQLDLSEEKLAEYTKTRDYVWDWLYSIKGPMRTFVWKGYFEDMPNDIYNHNRVQNIPLETARYLLEKPGSDNNMEVRIPALIYWVASVFETENNDGIKEQTACYWAMGSHTARYASLCAMWYEQSGNPWFKEQAFRFFNWATYVCDEHGHVRVGPDFPPPQYWFTDGYGDYIRHFLDGMAAIPEWAPRDENHLLKSTSVVSDIAYADKFIEYTTFDANSSEIFRLVSKPKSVSVNGNKLKADEYSWEKMDKGGVLRLSTNKGSNRVIQL